MNSSYVLKIENKAQNTWIRICTFSRLSILGFINRNALAFENLARTATPFGGSILSQKR